MTSNKILILTFKPYLKCLDSQRKILYDEGIKANTPCVVHAIALHKQMCIEIRLLLR